MNHQINMVALDKTLFCVKGDHSYYAVQMARAASIAHRVLRACADQRKFLENCGVIPMDKRQRM